LSTLCFLNQINVYPIEILNPNREPLTPENLKEISGLNLKDEQAEEVIWALTQYAQIVCNFTIKQEQSVKCKNEPEPGSQPGTSGLYFHPSGPCGLPP
jgi:hypothetical protein